MPVIPGHRVPHLLAVAALAVGVLVVLTPGSATAASPPCQQTFTNDVDVPIPDSASATSLIDVDENGWEVADVDVAFDISHTFDGDLEIWLRSYADDESLRDQNRLAMRDGSAGDNFTGTVLDDEASTPLSWNTAPFTGRFQPNQPLSLHDGAVGGRYRLMAYDRTAGDVGTILDWSLTFTYQTCDFDADGVEDHVDRCRGIAAATATGCPVTTRALTAKYKLGKFRGALSSPVSGCEAKRPVTIWKVRKGADRKVGTATSRADGGFALKRAKRVGRYYATSPRAAVTDVAECPAVTSRTFRVR